VILFGW